MSQVGADWQSGRSKLSASPELTNDAPRRKTYCSAQEKYFLRTPVKTSAFVSTFLDIPVMQTVKTNRNRIVFFTFHFSFFHPLLFVGERFFRTFAEEKNYEVIPKHSEALPEVGRRQGSAHRTTGSVALRI